MAAWLATSPTFFTISGGFLLLAFYHQIRQQAEQRRPCNLQRCRPAASCRVTGPSCMVRGAARRHADMSMGTAAPPPHKIIAVTDGGMGKNIFRSCTFSNKGKLETSICSAGQSQRHGPPLWFGPFFSGSRLRETAINGGGEVAQKPSTTPNRESFRSGRRSRGVCVRFELGSFAEIESRRGGGLAWR